jgi:hypothetical protein
MTDPQTTPDIGKTITEQNQTHTTPDLTPRFNDYDVNQLRDSIDKAVASALTDGSWFGTTPYLLKCAELMRNIDERLI